MDSEPNIAERVVRAFGGLTKMSLATGWPISTIQHWTRSGIIPAWRREKLIAAAAMQRVDLPADFLKRAA